MTRCSYLYANKSGHSLQREELSAFTNLYYAKIFGLCRNAAHSNLCGLLHDSFTMGEMVRSFSLGNTAPESSCSCGMTAFILHRCVASNITTSLATLLPLCDSSIPCWWLDHLFVTLTAKACSCAWHKSPSFQEQLVRTPGPWESRQQLWQFLTQPTDYLPDDRLFNRAWCVFIVCTPTPTSVDAVPYVVAPTGPGPKHVKTWCR